MVTNVSFAKSYSIFKQIAGLYFPPKNNKIKKYEQKNPHPKQDEILSEYVLSYAQYKNMNLHTHRLIA